MTIDANKWTKLNTNSSDFIIQNKGNVKVGLKASLLEPLANDEPDLILDRYNAISSLMVKKIFWGKPTGDRTANIGVVE